MYEGFDVMQKSLDEFITVDDEDYEIKDNVVGESSMECKREAGKCPYCGGVYNPDYVDIISEAWTKDAKNN